MKQITITVSLIVVAGVLAYAQMKSANSVEAKLIAQEKQAWEAFKNKNGKFFQDTTTENFQFVSPYGAATKAAAVAHATNHNSTIKGSTIENAKVTMLNNDSALLTYKYTQDVTCDGKPEPKSGWSSTIFVERSGKWLATYHQDTPANPTK